MPISRRVLLQKTGTFTAALALRMTGRQAPTTAGRAMLDPSTIEPFVDPLPRPPTAKPQGQRPGPSNRGLSVPYYRLAMRSIESQLHRDLKPTPMWGFESSSPGPTLETRSGQGLLVEWSNELPSKHFLPIDPHIHGAESDKPEVRAVVHVHGAKTEPKSDGYPEDWYEPGKSALYYYPNNQDAAQLWYHDHTLGINRLNVYAGLLGAFIIRDDAEDALGLPSGPYEIPLIICDRMLRPDGQLYYPVSPKPGAPWMPEVFGNLSLVNGKLFPYLDVEPRRYRFRVLNGSNSRFYHLSLSGGQKLHQVGCDQGLLPAPVELKNLVLAPGERADAVIDFANHRGHRIIFVNNALPVMQFRVSDRAVKDTSLLPAVLRPVPRIPESSAVRTRELALVEYEDGHGNPVIALLNNARWHAPVTENPVIDSTEIWSLINTTEDSHPIHLHLVRFQILDRRSFHRAHYQIGREVKYRGPARSPDAGEAGWKDTVQAHPGMVTRIIARFEGYAGRYVWHCHVLEHSDNEMMRPFDVVPAS